MRDPTPLETAATLERAILGRARTWLPAAVESYDPATGRARVVIGLIGSAPSPTGTLVDKPTPVPNVHVAWLRGGGYGVTGNLLPGDTGILLISHRAIDAWLIAGGPVPLRSDRAHALIDATFIPGLAPLSSPPPITSAQGMQIGAEDGSATVTMSPAVVAVEAAAIRLGQAAAYGVVGGAIPAAASALEAAVTALTTIVSVPVPEPPAAGAGAAIDAMAAALLALLQALAVSTKVQVETPP